MIKKILIALVIIIAALLVFAATRPDSFHVQRSASINAPTDKIFPLINDLHAWTTWSPYEKLDPDMKKAFSGSDNGVGAVYAWEGNKKAGAGRMTILQSVPDSRVNIGLEFFKPFKGNDTVDFTLDSVNGATTVTWAMHGPNPYMAKLIGIFCNMDKLIGKDFEAGLASLKAQAEK